jgi:hypothetical protein
VLLCGDAGAGKTLVTELARLVAASSEPAPSERSLDANSGGASAQLALFEELLNTLEGAATLDGLLLIIEDLHWADVSSRGEEVSLVTVEAGRASAALRPRCEDAAPPSAHRERLLLVGQSLLSVSGADAGPGRRRGLIARYAPTSRRTSSGVAGPSCISWPSRNATQRSTRST